MSEKRDFMKKSYIVLTLFYGLCTVSSNASYSLDSLSDLSEVLDYPIPQLTSDEKVDSHSEYDAKYLQTQSNDEPLDADTLLDFINSYKPSAIVHSPLDVSYKSVEELAESACMNPMFMPLIFNSVKPNYTIEIKRLNRSIDSNPLQLVTDFKLKLRSSVFVNSFTKEIIRNAEIENLESIHYDQKAMPRSENLVFQLDVKKPSIWLKPNLIGSIPKPDTKSMTKIVISPWRKLGVAKFQLTQTYVSPNWSKGGESNMAGLFTLFLEGNYSDSKNMTFENNLDLKIGMNTVSSDTLRKLNVSTDQLRAVSKFGLRMYNDWYYTVSGEFSTQIMNNYKTNTWNLKSAFLSPAKLFVGLGIDYKKNNREKGYNLSVLVTPFTLKMNYLYDIEHLSPKSYGIEPGKHLKSELGGKITANFQWKLSEQVRWSSKYYYYTDFEYVDTDWENTLDLILNNYFTTTIYLHLKLDDRLKREPGESLLQTQQLLSFGMAYRW